MVKKETIYLVGDIVLKAAREIWSVPNHPKRAALDDMLNKFEESILLGRSIFGFESEAALVNAIAEGIEKMQQADKESSEILALIETGGRLVDFAALPPVSPLTLLAVAARIDEKARAKAENIWQLMQSKRLSPEGRKKGGQAKKDAARPKREAVEKINAGLLARPVSEGWGSVEKRADYISKRTGYSVSYVKALIAKPRKTKLA
jgi:hypothetical protein